jgi:hypothetical protein
LFFSFTSSVAPDETLLRKEDEEEEEEELAAICTEGDGAAEMAAGYIEACAVVFAARTRTVPGSLLVFGARFCIRVNE